MTIQLQYVVATTTEAAAQQIKREWVCEWKLPIIFTVDEKNGFPSNGNWQCELVRTTIIQLAGKRVCICINNTHKTVNEITQTINYTILWLFIMCVREYVGWDWRDREQERERAIEHGIIESSNDSHWRSGGQHNSRLIHPIRCVTSYFLWTCFESLCFSTAQIYRQCNWLVINNDHLRVAIVSAHAALRYHHTLLTRC